MAIDFGKVVEERTNDDNKIEAIVVEIEPGLADRFMREYLVMVEDNHNIGRLGYVLGLHSAVFLSKTNGRFSKSMMGYDAVVEGRNIGTGVYMFATLSEKVVEDFDPDSAFYLEDYIYLMQYERLGKATAPREISEDAFLELFESLTKLWDAVSLLITKRTQRMLAMRYAGIALGMLVAWDYRSEVQKMAAIATELALDDKLRPEIYKTFVEALKFAEELGDVEL